MSVEVGACKGVHILISMAAQNEFCHKTHLVST